MNSSADRLHAFDWVDDYMANVRGHFEIRREDSLLIVLPNRAVKLNASGLGILERLQAGVSINAVLDRFCRDAQRRTELYHFLCDFRCMISDSLGEGRDRRAVDVVPHPVTFNVLPVLSELAVTYRCNLRCAFCYAACGCQSGHDTGDELTTAQAQRVLRVIRRDAKVPSVSFTGGEPLLRDDLEQLVADATGIGLRTNLITNACLASGRRARALRRAGLRSAQVSLEGPTASVHDALTGVAGSFDRTLAGLAALREAGVHVHTNTTLNAGNVDHLDELVDLIADLGLARMSANMVIPTGSAADTSLQIRYSRIGPIVRDLREAARARRIEFMWYSPTPMCLFNPLAHGLGNKSCAACDGLLSVAPNGDVLPCSSYAQPVGNLLTQPFVQVWQSAQARFLRNKDYAPRECDDCEDFAPCAGACPLYWSAMGTDELATVRRPIHATA